MIRNQLQFRSIRNFGLPAASLVILCFAGCAEADSNSATGGGSSAVSTNGGGNIESDPHVHAHPSEGPHHGDLVELGNEEFHAEVVHGKAGRITVYILDSAAKAAVPIDATELAINITNDGNAEQFKLLAERDSADPEGKSSRFSLTDEELASDLDSHDATAKLVVMINGKSYSGKIAHDHDADHKH